MDFSVVTVKCYDTVKVHHDKRWLRQQRMLVISSNEVLNCPFPAKGTPAAQLFDLFSTSPATAVVVAPVAAPVASAHDSSSLSQQPRAFPTVASIDEKTKQLETIYERACFITGKERVTFDDIKLLFNPSKEHLLEDISGVSLKGSDHICINFKNDHCYYYNTPLAIELSHVLRTRSVAHSTAKLVEGNFAAAAAEAVSLIPSPRAGSPMSPNSSATALSPPSAAAAAGAAASNPDLSAARGYNRIADLFQAGVIQLPSLSDVDHLQSAALELTRTLDWAAGSHPAAQLAAVSAAVQKLSKDAESWVPRAEDFAAAAALYNNKKSAAAVGGGAVSTSSFTSVAALSAAASTAALAPTQRGNGVNKQEEEHSEAAVLAASVRAGAPPLHVIEFRRRFNEIRQTLVDDFLVASKNDVVPVERSFTDKMAFWRSTRKIPQFEEPDEAELVAELALQNLLFRSEATFRNLWLDVSIAHAAERSLFQENCRFLTAPVVPFSYFGIPPDFESVRFDLVRHHLQSLSACKTPSSMLNAVVSSIKCVIVCVKARHILSRRWSRAMSATSTTTTTTHVFGSRPSSPSYAPPTTNNNNNSAAAAAAAVLLDDEISSVGSSPTSDQPSAPASVPPTSAAFWTKDELDAIAAESKKHSFYNTDDILPVFIYIVVFSNMPTLVFYYRFLEHLSYDGEQSERSFYVTVFFSAIQWIIDWKKPTRRELFPHLLVQQQQQQQQHQKTEKTERDATLDSDMNINVGSKKGSAVVLEGDDDLLLQKDGDSLFAVAEKEEEGGGGGKDEVKPVAMAAANSTGEIDSLATIIEESSAAQHQHQQKSRHHSVASIDCVSSTTVSPRQQHGSAAVAAAGVGVRAMSLPPSIIIVDESNADSVLSDEEWMSLNSVSQNNLLDLNSNNNVFTAHGPFSTSWRTALASNVSG